MFVDSLLLLLLQNIYLVFIISVLSYFLHNKYQRGLNKYPGPFLASFTDWWRFYDVFKRRPDITQIRLHRELGDVVRLGPNILSFADPRVLKTIYGLNKGFVKSEFYPVQQAVSRGRRVPTLFSTTDEVYHAALRRSVNSAFSMSTLVQYEQYVDSTSRAFLGQIKKRFADKSGPKGVCDFTRWLQYYAFDVIGEITYSKRLGFVDEGKDVDGIIAYLDGSLSYAGPIGQMPILDCVFRKNPVLMWLDRLGFSSAESAAAVFAKKRIAERLEEKNQAFKLVNRRQDLLSKFMQAKEDHPDVMTDGRVLAMALSMTFAGSDTTAITLSAVFYYLLKNPRCYHTLQQEIDNAALTGLLHDRDLISWPESQKMPYLDACVKEAMRLHPAAGTPYERIVPPQGVNILGEHIKGGTIVGCSAWVIHRRPEVFGEDAEFFRPERWLEAGTEKLKEMNGSMIQFGMGARTCIGKNISLLEVYKMVPTLLRQFEIQLDDPKSEWHLHNAWFVKPFGFNVRFISRSVKAGGDG